MTCYGVEVQRVQRGGLVAQVVASLSDQVLDGAWVPGERLPSLVELGGELDVGLSTVREAVQVLVHRGVLESRQGSGTFVRADQSDLPLSLRLARAATLDVYEARRSIEVEGARLAALRRTDTDLVTLRAAATRRAQARLCGGLSEWALADLDLHRAVLAATHNPVLGVLFDSFADAQAQAFTDQSLDPGSDVDTAAEHEQLVDAIADRDPTAAVAATLSYLDQCEADLRRHSTQRHDSGEQHHP